VCPKLSRAAAKLGLAAASIGLTLLALEGLVRLLAPQGRGKEERTIALYTEHDQLLGWRKRPGARATLHRRDYTVDVAINSRGLRDVERTYESPAFRILALGDSFVEGYSVPLEATVTRVLEVSLSRPDCPVEVLNGGSAAWSTDQELLFYRSDGARYGSKVVALFFYFNDVLFNDCDRYFGNPKPRLVVGSNGSLTLTGVPVPSWPAPAGADPSSEPEPEPQGGSALLSFTANRLRIGVPRVYNRLAASSRDATVAGLLLERLGALPQGTETVEVRRLGLTYAVGTVVFTISREPGWPRAWNSWERSR